MEDTGSSNSADGHPPGAKRQQVTGTPREREDGNLEASWTPQNNYQVTESTSR